MTKFRRRRRPIVWLCIAATLLLGLGTQLHGLSHALQAVQASANKHPLAAHAQVCEQCLLYAALDAAVPTSAATPPPRTRTAAESGVPAARACAAAFTAYLSRAPPRLG